MQCGCGGQTTSGKYIRKAKSKRRVMLLVDYDQCESCGRRTTTYKNAATGVVLFRRG